MFGSHTVVSSFVGASISANMQRTQGIYSHPKGYLPLERPHKDPDSWKSTVLLPGSPRFSRRRGPRPPRPGNPFTPPTQVEGLEGEWRINRAHRVPTLRLTNAKADTFYEDSLLPFRHKTHKTHLLPGTTDQQTKKH